MIYRRVLTALALSAAACSAGVAIFWYENPVLHIRYRLTADVMVDGKIYTGSDVVDVIIEKASYFRLGIGDFRVLMNSHCPSISLGSHGTLFIVDSIPFLVDGVARNASRSLRYPSAAPLDYLPYEIYPVKPRGRDFVKAALAHQSVSGNLSVQAGEVDVPLDLLPMIARFVNINDPDSLEELDPNDLSSSLGPGSRMVRATLRITDEALTPIPSYWPEWLLGLKSPSELLVWAPHAESHSILQLWQIRGSK